MCLNIGTPKTINFPFETNKKLMALGVPILKHLYQFLPFLNNPKDLDLSYKMDLDLWDCFGRKTLSYNRRNTVNLYFMTVKFLVLG